MQVCVLLFFLLRNCPSRQYSPVRTSEGYLQVRESEVVGFGGASTGDGLFTLKDIPRNQFICAYAPGAVVRRHNPLRTGDYLIVVQLDGETRVDIDGSENRFEIGLGRICNDGSFPYALNRAKFSKIIDRRVNCEFTKRKGEVWVRSKRHIRANEELLVCYTEDCSYWKALFTDHQLSLIKGALQACEPNLQDANRAIRNLRLPQD